MVVEWDLLGFYPLAIKVDMGLSENVGYIPNEIAIFHRDNDQQNHWVQWGTLFSDKPMQPLQTITLWQTLTKKLWKDPPFLMGKSTISMAMFNSKLLVDQRVYPIKSH